MKFANFVCITTVSNKNRVKMSVLFTTVSCTNRGDMYFNFNIFIRVYEQALFVIKKIVGAEI